MKSLAAELKAALNTPQQLQKVHREYLLALEVCQMNSRRPACDCARYVGYSLK
jgi:hypothetical protein